RSASTRRPTRATSTRSARPTRSAPRPTSARTRSIVSSAGPERQVMADEQRDVIEILEHDHREVEQMFAELESLRGAATDEARERRKELADQVTIELVRHSVAEEVLVYPKVEH